MPTRGWGMSIASYRAQIADYSRQIEDARARIAQLERALDGLDDFDAAMVRELASREDAVQQKRALVYRLQAVPNARVVQSCSEILNRNISQVMAQFEEGYAGVRAEIARARERDLEEIQELKRRIGILEGRIRDAQACIRALELEQRRAEERAARLRAEGE